MVLPTGLKGDRDLEGTVHYDQGKTPEQAGSRGRTHFWVQVLGPRQMPDLEGELPL